MILDLEVDLRRARRLNVRWQNLALDQHCQQPLVSLREITPNPGQLEVESAAFAQDEGTMFEAT
jgi:hypothetical protein